MQLVTERLLLRDVHPDDWQPMAAYNADPEMRRFFLPGQGTERQVKRWVRGAHKTAQRRTRLYYGLAVVHRERNEVIGSCVLAATAYKGNASVGWELNRAFWNQGYMTEAARALTDFGFAHLQLRYITADCIVGNAASIRVMEKIGMQRVRRGAWHSWLLGLSYLQWRPIVRHVKFQGAFTTETLKHGEQEGSLRAG